MSAVYHFTSFFVRSFFFSFFRIFFILFSFFRYTLSDVAVVSAVVIFLFSPLLSSLLLLLLLLLFFADLNNKHSWHLLPRLEETGVILSMFFGVGMFLPLAVVPCYLKAQDTRLMPLSLSCSRTALPGLRRGRATADLVTEARYSEHFFTPTSIMHPT